MTTLTEEFQDGGFQVSVANKTLSYEAVTVLSGEDLKAGTVVGNVSSGTATAAAGGSNTGDGAMGAITVTGGAINGDYILTIIAAVANAGTFTLETPEGVSMDVGNVAAAYSAGGLAFTLADGAADFIVGDSFTITAVIIDGKYKEYDPTNTDGSENASGVILNAVDATAADTSGVIVRREAEINTSELVWFTGATGAQITAGLADLALQNIVGR